MADQVRLPLSIFERYMLRDHSAEYPMTQLIQLEFQGALDPDRLAQAIKIAIRRHPLLTARVEGTGKRAEWVISTKETPPVQFHVVRSLDEIDAWNSRYIDPCQGQHLVAWHLLTAQGSNLVLAVNHIACDGIGCLQFIADWLTVYSELCHGRYVPDTDIAQHIAKLPQREAPGWRTSDRVVTRWEAFKGFLRESWNWYSRSPAVIAAPRQHAESSTGKRLFEHSLSIQETRGLRNAAQAERVTLNDLLMREIMLHLARWNERYDKRRPQSWLRILMPTSLRSKQDKSLSAVNRLGYTFLTHRVSECADPAQLLASLAQETAAIREWNLGQMFLDGLGIAEKIPGLWNLFTRTKSCLATTVYSSIGEVTRRWSETLPREGKTIRVGDALLERIYGSPPLRHGTRAVILSSLFSDKMTISGLTDPRYFDEALRQEWWNSLIAQLRETAALGWKQKEVSQK